jgi:Polyketide cyclase / dehydrase and lipid transport
MIYGEASTTVTAPPAQVLDLVCDLERYKLADTKIRKVPGTRIDGDRLVVRFRSRLRGLPAPAAGRQIVRSGDQRPGITSVPSWHSRLVRFSGSVTCAPATAGTRVVNREEFHATALLRPLSGRFLGSWLTRDIEAEVSRVGRLPGTTTADPAKAES